MNITFEKSKKFLLLDRCLRFSFSEEGWKGPMSGSEMPANSELLWQHVQVQAIPTSKCSLTECICLRSSSVIFNLNGLQCVSRFNSHLPGNYTTMNSNCKQTLNPMWLNASGSLLRTWAEPTCLASHPSAGFYPWLATIPLPDVSQIVSSPAVKSPFNFMQSKCNNLDRGGFEVACLVMLIPMWQCS